MTYIANPINIKKWVKENKHFLQPPICNKLIFQEKEAFIIVIGGANARKEFHYNEAPEFFFQLKGDMLLKTLTNGKMKDISIKEGEIFLLPAGIAHSPIRYENTVGIVVDMRHPTKKDGLQWYCQQCNNLLYEEYLKVSDIEKDFFPVYERFFTDIQHRTCSKCGQQMRDSYLEQKFQKLKDSRKQKSMLHPIQN